VEEVKEEEGVEEACVPFTRCSSCPGSTASSGDVLSREPAAILRAAARGGS